MAAAGAIIGIHDGHNASACLLAGGRISYAVQEERLTGCKNQSGPPREAIRACLGQAGIGAREVELAFASLRHTPTRFLSTDQVRAFRRDAGWWGRFRRLALWQPCYRLRRDLGWRERRSYAAGLGFETARAQRFEHHLCHAATAYYGMRGDRRTSYLVVTADGYGDLESSTVWVGEHNGLRKIASSRFGDSLGAIYGLVTFAMGFVPLEHEYKLMGMAPYASEAQRRRAAPRSFAATCGLRRRRAAAFERRTLRRRRSRCSAISSS